MSDPMFTTVRTKFRAALATPPPAPLTVPLQGTEQTSDLLKRLFRGFDGSLALRLWNGTTLRLGRSESDLPAPPFTLVFRSPTVMRTMVLGRDRLRLVESYFRGDIDIEGDFFAALRLKDHLNSFRLSVLDRVRAVFFTLRLPASRAAPPPTDDSTLHGQAVRAHSKAENRKSIQFHYDVSNKFYALWLDEAMVYSCAYFEHPGDNLEQGPAGQDRPHLPQAAARNRGSSARYRLRLGRPGDPCG